MRDGAAGCCLRLSSRLETARHAYRTSTGASSLQALCLGISLVHSLLEERLSKGGSFLTDDQLPFDLNTCFGSFGMKSA